MAGPGGCASSGRVAGLRLAAARQLVQKSPEKAAHRLVALEEALDAARRGIDALVSAASPAELAAEAGALQRAALRAADAVHTHDPPDGSAAHAARAEEAAEAGCVPVVKAEMEEVGMVKVEGELAGNGASRGAEEREVDVRVNAGPVLGVRTERVPDVKVEEVPEVKVQEVQIEPEAQLDAVVERRVGIASDTRGETVEKPKLAASPLERANGEPVAEVRAAPEVAEVAEVPEAEVEEMQEKKMQAEVPRRRTVRRKIVLESEDEDEDQGDVGSDVDAGNDLVFGTAWVKPNRNRTRAEAPGASVCFSRDCVDEESASDSDCDASEGRGRRVATRASSRQADLAKGKEASGPKKPARPRSLGQSLARAVGEPEDSSQPAFVEARNGIESPFAARRNQHGDRAGIRGSVSSPAQRVSSGTRLAGTAKETGPKKTVDGEDVILLDVSDADGGSGDDYGSAPSVSPLKASGLDRFRSALSASLEATRESHGSPGHTQGDDDSDSDLVIVRPHRKRTTRRRPQPTPMSQKRQRTASASGRGQRRDSVAEDGNDESSTSDSGLENFIVDDEDVEVSSSDEEEDGGRDGEWRSHHPPEHMFASRSILSAPDADDADVFNDNAEAFCVYLQALATTALDPAYRELLVLSMGGGKIDDTHGSEVKLQIQRYTHAVQRIERDLFESRAVQYVADGRWQAVLRALRTRPFIQVLNEVNLLPQPVNLQNKLILYCNGCNYRPGTLYYRDPDVTCVLLGPKVDGSTSERVQSWPKSIVEDGDTGEFSFPLDMTADVLNENDVEKKYRKTRMRQWRKFHSEKACLPHLEWLRAAKNGCPESAWGREEHLDVEDYSDLEGSEDEDEVRCGTLEGFGMNRNCAEKCVLYHKMLWIRVATIRTIRNAILQCLNGEDIASLATSPSESVVPQIVEMVVSSSGKYTVLKECRKHANSLLHKSTRTEAGKRAIQYDARVVGADEESSTIGDIFV